MLKLLRIISSLQLLTVGAAVQPPALGSAQQESRVNLSVRAIYGGIPKDVLEGTAQLSDYGVNAVCIGSGSISQDRITLVHSQGGRLFAEFNTLHVASYLKDHPDATPVGPDGLPSPPPEGWQGICPTHPGYRAFRMAEFRALLEQFPIDGVWLDYHHSHASWERDVPLLPDTCFCARCLSIFRRDTGLDTGGGGTSVVANRILADHFDTWVRWRCALLTDWVREFRQIIEAIRPGVLLGTFHAPWTDTDYAGARMQKLAIDLKSQARYIDVFSPMVYHARFGHAQDLGWISRQIAWLGSYLDLEGTAEEDRKIWPIVQLSDWGETVSVADVPKVLEQGTRLPATGVFIFAWRPLEDQPEKIAAMKHSLRMLRPIRSLLLLAPWTAPGPSFPHVLPWRLSDGLSFGAMPAD